MKNYASSFLAVLAVTLMAIPIAAKAAAKPLQSFTLEDRLAHRWQDELVHFDFDVPAAGVRAGENLALTNLDGVPCVSQITGLKREGGRVRGQVWTVVNMVPMSTLGLQLRAGKPPGKTDLQLAQEADFTVVSNKYIAVRLPRYAGTFATPRGLVSLPAPIAGVRGTGKEWLGGASWFNTGAALQVKEAATTIVENGPVRIIVKQRVTLIDGRSHTTTIQLGSRQEAALISEDSDINNPLAGWRLSMKEGLGADHVFWNNQWKKTENADTFSLADTAVNFGAEGVVAKLRPWSFWWNGDITLYAGFYKKAAEPDPTAPFVSVLMLNPSRWTPGDWDGFDRLEIPIKSGPGGRLDMDLAFLANTVKDAPSKPAMIMQEPDPSKWAALLAKYKDVFVPLHREWAITAGTTGDNVRDVKTTMTRQYAGDPEGISKMRRQLLKYSEFPLEEVKDYGFSFKNTNAMKKRPFLLLSADDIERVRRQAKTNPALMAQIEAAKKYIAASGAIKDFEAGGAAALQGGGYAGIDYVQKLTEAYLGSEDPVYAKLMGACVRNLTLNVRKVFLEVPNRPGLASYGPWQAEEFSRLLLTYDLVAGRGLLTPDEEKAASDSIVFGGQVLSNPDYWSLERGLASANPNMTSMIRLPLGLVGLYLAGHPRAEAWASGAEDELKRELNEWIGPNGAWVECPGYQGASLDGVMLYATAVRNVHGRDYFAQPKFKMMMDYFGFLLTPPDRRLPVRDNMDIPTMSFPGALPPAALPSIGDTPVGSIYPFNGWMAAQTAKTDPEYSKRQQFFWKIQNYHFNNGNRAKGFTVAGTDTGMEAVPPADLSRGFPGFGSLMRSSWIDPKASYLAHRTGPFSHHYHQDFNSIEYRAKGAPLCLDFANQYAPVRREEPWYHNRVSFNIYMAKPYEDNWKNVGGELVEMRPLSQTLDYSYGKSFGRANEEDHRYMLLIKSADQMGANYVVMRDVTKDGKTANQPYYWNLWCLSKEPQINGNIVHFPGQFDVDLDVHMLSPAMASPVAPKFSTDFWKWEDYKHVWGVFKEEQYGIRLQKTGSAEDYLAVLYPRATGQAAAAVTPLAGNAAMRVGHMEGTDLVLLSPGKPVTAKDGEAAVSGEIAFVRRYTDGTTRLAVVKGQSNAAYGDWAVGSTDAVSLEIRGNAVNGESSGNAHAARITVPASFANAAVTVDGKAVAPKRAGTMLTLDLPAGGHKFTLVRK